MSKLQKHSGTNRQSAMLNGLSPQNMIFLLEHETYKKRISKLYRYSMALIEEASCYIDDEGKKTLLSFSPELAAFYQKEAMHMSTRLMQIASWLLLWRAGQEKEMSNECILAEKAKISFKNTSPHTFSPLWQKLPQKFQDLVMRSLRLEERICILDQDMAKTVKNFNKTPIAQQFERVKAAFST